MKNSKQRKVILDIINKSNNHLDAYGIYELAKKSIPNISLGTVYRNLGNLEYENIISAIVVDGIKHYDKVIPHYHFVCKSCKQIIDIFDLDIPKVKIYNGNLVDDYEIVLKGICCKCQKEDNDGIKRK